MPISRRRLLATAAGALPLALGACNKSGPAYDLPPGIYAQIIDMTSTLSFSPDVVSIKSGGAVLWRNQTAFTHSVIFDPQKATDAVDVTLPQGVEPFASGDIPPGETFAHKFTVPGSYRYICAHHEGVNMHGSIIVTE
jgi:plastocyanin